MLLGDPDQPPREVQWYLLRAVPDIERNEPRNVGVIVRLAESDRLSYRWCDDVSWLGMERSQYREVTHTLEAMIEKYGTRYLHWITKKPIQIDSIRGSLYRVEAAGRKLAAGRVDTDALFKRLVGRQAESVPIVEVALGLPQPRKT